MSDVRWEGLSHEEIYAKVQQGPGRGASADAESAWTTVGTTIRAVDEQLTRAVRQIGVDWQGAAADHVHAGMTAMGGWARDAADNAALTTDGIAAQAAGAQHVRDAMPPPRHDLDTAVALVATGGYAPRATNVGAIEDGMAEDRALAVDLMNRYTTDSTTHQHLMNYWTQPPSVVVQTVAAEPAHGAPGRPAGAVSGRAAADVTGSRSVGAAVPGPGAPGGTRASATTAGGSGERAPSGPVVARAGTVPGLPAPGSPGAGGPTASGPARRSASPAGRSPVPGVPAVPLPGALPGTGAGRPGSTAPATDPSRSAAEPPGAEPPGGVRRIGPGVPARPGAGGAPGSLDAPWHTPSARPTVVSPGVPRTDGVVAPPPRSETGGAGARAVVGGPGEDAVAGRPTQPAGDRSAAAGHGILPLAGAAGRPPDQEHRRPGYLVDDTDAFADDRWFTPPVIGGDDLEVRRA